VVKSFDDKRITYHRLPENKGNAAARNLGVSKSSYPWITFLDSDDVYHSQYIEAFTKHIKDNPETNFCFCGSETVRESKVEKHLIWQPEAVGRGHFLKELRIGIGCGVVIHEECFREVGLFDERLRVAVDTDFLIRLERRFPFTVLKKVLVSVYVHNGIRVRHNTTKLKEAYELIIDKNRKEIESDPKLFIKWHYKLMWLQYHSGDITAGNQTYHLLKHRTGLTSKSLIIKYLFNLLPAALAIRVHKKLSSW
jgi:glycosyltransferase involved in cell wall biosynthesis